MINRIYLAGGCFWGVEGYFKRIKGVVDTECGYANGNTKNPSYEDVCRKNTGHAEAVRIYFDDNTISLEDLLIYYFRFLLTNREMMWVHSIEQVFIIQMRSSCP